MANIPITRIQLNGRFPGAVNRFNWFPTKTANSGVNGKGWDNTVDNFSSADDTARALNAGNPSGGGNRTPLGTKIACYYDDTVVAGWYTMQYLCLHSFEDGMDISKDFSDGKFWCAPADLSTASTSEWADGNGEVPYFVVTRCTTGSDATKGAPMCIPCSTHIYSDGTGVLAAGYGDGYGWFLVDGVMPVKDITLLDDETGAGGGVEITAQIQRGAWICEITGDQPILMGTDMSDLADATNVAGTGKDMAGMIQGWACGSVA